MEKYLNELNTIRNKFAHRLDYRLTFDEAFNLAKSAAIGGIDFSDDGIHTSKTWAAENYQIEGILEEVFRNTVMDLDFIIKENGGYLQFT